MVYLLADTKNFTEHAEIVSFICYTLQQRISEAEALALIRSHIPTIQKEWRHHQKANVDAMTDESTTTWISNYLHNLISTRKNEDLQDAPFYEIFYRLQLKAALAELNQNGTLKELSMSVYDLYRTPDNTLLYITAALSVASISIHLLTGNSALSALFATMAIIQICWVSYEEFYNKPKEQKAFYDRGLALYEAKIREIPENQKEKFPSIFNASGTKIISIIDPPKVVNTEVQTSNGLTISPSIS